MNGFWGPTITYPDHFLKLSSYFWWLDCFWKMAGNFLASWLPLKIMEFSRWRRNSTNHVRPPLFSTDQHEHTITPANWFTLKMTCRHEKYPGWVWKPMWRSTFSTPVKIGPAQLRFVTETATKSPFLCVNKSSIRYAFRAGARAVHAI